MTTPPDAHDPRRRKHDTRRTIRSRRDALTADARATASAAIATSTAELLAHRLAPHATVALYAAKGSEVDTAALDAALRAAGFVVAYPRVLGDARALAFHRVDDLAALAPTGPLQIREPDPATTAATGITEIAAFLIPGLAFDRAGGRIGWGRGHYDATLAVASPTTLRIGLAFHCQLVDDPITSEPHDIPLDAIVTERELIEPTH